MMRKAHVRPNGMRLGTTLSAGFAIVFILLPGATGTQDLGSETEPEVRDPEGDVQYAPTYAGPQDSAYVDILVAWFDYDSRDDVINITVKVADTNPYSDPPAATLIRCFVAFRGYVGEEMSGSYHLQWSIEPQSGEMSQTVGFTDSDGRGRAVDYEFSVTSGQPGYFQYRLTNRQQILNQASFFKDPSLECHESQWVPGADLYINDNYDTAQGSATYDVTSLKPDGRPDGEGDADPTANASDEPIDENGGASPLVSALATMAVICAVFVAKAARQRHNNR